MGAFSASPGPYGTYDMGGDVFQWNEANIFTGYRGLRGGSFDEISDYLASFVRIYGDPSVNYIDAGFRVAMVPEPGSIVMMAMIVVGGLIYCWQRRRV